MNSKQREIVCSAPGRAGIIGNPTDMYGGAVLSCSVGMRARVSITPAPDLVLQTSGQECRIASRDDLRPQGDRFDVARAILDYMR
ncbi:MAG: galactokinase family protein, partial [Delftia sp.]|nr:galactokinase family protein [Delftia sp.]